MLTCDVAEYNKENYKIKKSILRDAVIRVDYEDIVDLTINDLIFKIEKYLNIKKFKLIAESKMADIQVEINQNLDPDVNNNIPINIYNRRTVYTFKHTDDKLNLLLIVTPIFCYIQQNGSFITDNPKYLGFDTLSTLLMGVLDFINSEKPLFYTRIGIRKINSLFTKNKSSLKNAFAPIFIKNIDFFPPKIKNKGNPKVDQIYNFPIGEFNVNLRTLLQIIGLMSPRNQIVNVYNFNFDIDTYLINNEENLSHDNLMIILKEANDTLFAIFLRCLSESARKSLVENKNITEITL